MTLTLVGGRGVGDGGVGRCWFRGDGVHVNSCEILVLIGSENVGKEAIVVGGVPAPGERDVLNFAH